MRSFFRLTVCLLALALFLTGTAQGEKAACFGYVRIVSGDPSPEAQMQKHALRARLNELMARRSTPTVQELRLHLAATFPCTVQIRPWRPETEMPVRPTLYIQLGHGGGPNWWGVLCGDTLSAMLESRQKSAGQTGAENHKTLFDWWQKLLSLLGLAEPVL